LWNRQRYLTDDEIESGREGTQPTRRERSNRLGGRQEVDESDCEPEKRLHRRQGSSEEENLNLIRKRSSRQAVKSQ
jgi:hypothetical protein